MPAYAPLQKVSANPYFYSTSFPPLISLRSRRSVAVLGMGEDGSNDTERSTRGRQRPSVEGGGGGSEVPNQTRYGSRDTRAASWERARGREKTTRRTRGASWVAGGCALRLGQGAGPTRTTQGRRVGRLEPKLHSLGVVGEFGHVPESAKYKRRGRRACPTAPLGAHGAMASARRARRH